MPGRSGGRGGAQPPVQQKQEKTLSDKQTAKEDSRDSEPPSQQQVSRVQSWGAGDCLGLFVQDRFAQH